MYFGRSTMTSKKSNLAATGEGGMWHTMTWGLLLEHISSFHHIPIMGMFPHSHIQTSSTYFILYNMHQPILWTYPPPPPPHTQTLTVRWLCSSWWHSRRGWKTRCWQYGRCPALFQCTTTYFGMAGDSMLSWVEIKHREHCCYTLFLQYTVDNHLHLSTQSDQNTSSNRSTVILKSVIGF